MTPRIHSQILGATLSMALLVPLAAWPAPAAPSPAPTAAADLFQSELTEWQTHRDTRLRSADGWLTLVGLDWLKEGDNVVGSAKDATVKLPDGKAPAKAATLVVAKDQVTFRPEPGSAFTVEGKPVTEPLALLPDSDAKGPTMVDLGALSFYVIARNGKLAVRVKDSESATRTNFKGVERFTPDPSWRVIAHFEPYPAGKKLQVPTILGTVDAMTEPGALVFERNGQKYRLDAVLEEGETDLFIIFGDQTNRKDTYGGGRFLYAKPADSDGHVMLDFNRSYNPPCVFTPYATCPLPPPQNKLPVRIEAGEKMYGKGFHG